MESLTINNNNPSQYPGIKFETDSRKVVVLKEKVESPLPQILEFRYEENPSNNYIEFYTVSGGE